MPVSYYQKYRPRKLSGIVGQKHVKQYFKNAVENKKVSHAYLLTGKRGTGKTTIARIISLIMNCEDGPSLTYDVKSDICKSIINGSCQDVHEMDAATNTSIDDIRNIRKIAKTFPIRCRKRVFIIDEVHCLRGPAVSALLKILEEPPESAMFILATTEPNKIPAAIQSRCQRFDLKDIPVKVMMAYLSKVAKAEKAKIVRNEALETIAKKAMGSMRDALTGLEVVFQHGNGEITPEVVAEVIAGDLDPYVFCDLIDSILSLDYKNSIKIIKDKTTSGTTPQEFFDGILEYSHDMMLQKAIGSNDYLELTEDVERRWSEVVEKYDLEKFISVHSVVIDYVGMLQTTPRPDILIDAYIIDVINRLE